MHKLIGASIAAMTLVSAASASTVENTSLATINGPVGATGAGFATTTTDGTGTTTTVSGPSGDGSRAYIAPVASTWQQSAVGGGGTVGITTDYARSGNGSAFFSTTGSDAKADLQYMLPAPVALSTLTSLSFDFLRDSASTAGGLLSPVLRLDIRKGTVFAGSLVFENVYQTQVNAPTDVWTTLSATLTSGIFWATNGALGPTFAAADGGQKTLQAWMDANSDAQLNVTGVSIGVGSGWGGTFEGAVDNVGVNFTRAAAVSANFEVAAAVPEPATWAMFIGGFGLVGTAMRRRRKVSVHFA